MRTLSQARVLPDRSRLQRLCLREVRPASSNHNPLSLSPPVKSSWSPESKDTLYTMDIIRCLLKCYTWGLQGLSCHPGITMDFLKWYQLDHSNSCPYMPISIMFQFKWLHCHILRQSFTRTCRL